jgi:hypothetical protein
MGSMSMVEDALTDLIAAQLYPNGSPPSVLGYKVKIYAGWPDPQQLDTDMVETSGAPTAAHVSVYPQGMARNVTRFPNEAVESAIPAATYTLAQAGQDVTVGGAAPSPYVAHNLAIFLAGKPYVVTATAGQTPAQVATALAAVIAVDWPTVSRTGAVLHIPGAALIGALRVGTTGSTVREVRRQEQDVQIAAWSSNPASRAAVSDAYDAMLSNTPRLTLADGSIAKLTFKTQREDDFTQRQRIYRRLLVFTVEFGVTLEVSAPQIVAGQVDAALTDGTQLPTTYS